MTLKIDRSTRQGFTVFLLSGRFEAAHIEELEGLFELQKNSPAVVLDLRDIRLADRGAVKFLARCEAGGAAVGKLSGLYPGVDGERKGLSKSHVHAEGWREEKAMSIQLLGASRAKESGASAAGNMEGWSEAKLIAAAKSGHDAAFGVLCERHEEMILRGDISDHPKS